MLKTIKTDDYEVIARARVKLADGRIGWTGVMHAAYSIDRTVVGFRDDFIVVPQAYQQGAAGGSGERAYAKLIDSESIRARA
jgi:hypothetical protein